MLVASESRCDQSGGSEGRGRDRSWDWLAKALLPCGLMWLAGMVLRIITCGDSMSALGIMRLRWSSLGCDCEARVPWA